MQVENYDMRVYSVPMSLEESAFWMQYRNCTCPVCRKPMKVGQKLFRARLNKKVPHTWNLHGNYLVTHRKCLE